MTDTPPKTKNPLQIAREGERYERFNRIIKVLIVQTDDALVFLDEYKYVWWDYPSDRSSLPRDFGRVRNRVAALEAIPIRYLRHPDQWAFRRLVGEGVARVLGDNDPSSAAAIFDEAEKFVKARSDEIARKWYLKTGLTGLAVSVGLMVAVFLLHRYFAAPTPSAAPGSPATPISEAARFWPRLLGDSESISFLYSILAGALGTSLSVISRLRSFPLDPAAGLRLHVLEFVARVAAGMIGAFLAVLAVKAKLIAPALGAEGELIAGQLLLCIVAGASERFVPNLISRVESTANSGLGRTPSNAPDPGAGTGTVN